MVGLVKLHILAPILMSLSFSVLVVAFLASAYTKVKAAIKQYLKDVATINLTLDKFATLCQKGLRSSKRSNVKTVPWLNRTSFQP